MNSTDGLSNCSPGQALVAALMFLRRVAKRVRETLRWEMASEMQTIPMIPSTGIR